MPSPFIELDVETPSGERTVKVTNPDKTYFSGLPEGKGRKLDLVEYYLAVADGVVRGLRERPTVLKRHPGGAETEAIYQKRVPDNRPPWMETVTVQFPERAQRHRAVPRRRRARRLGREQRLPGLPPVADPARPRRAADELRIDLDPMPGTGWATCWRRPARCTACSTSSASCRTRRRAAARASTSTCASSRAGPSPRCGTRPSPVAREIERRRPDLATARWWKEERGERVFLDFNRMARDQTIASAYSVRARREATVSAPVTWEELPDCQIADFDIWTMRERFARLGDLHAAIDDVHHDLTPLLELYERQGEGEAPFPPQFAKQEGEPLRSRPSVREPAAAKRAAAERRRQRGDAAEQA
jgi:DNA primase